MKYYIVEVIDGTKSMYDAESFDSAKQRFHKECGGWINKDGVNEVLVFVVNSCGGTYTELKEYWKREVSEVVE